MYTRALNNNSPFEVIVKGPAGKDSLGAIDLSSGFEVGDLIFCRTSSRRDSATGITHVIIYAGNWDNQHWAWHASSSNNAIELKTQERFTLEKGFEYKGALRLKK